MWNIFVPFHDEIFSKATHINFICPMRFDAFPLDTQVSGVMIWKRPSQGQTKPLIQKQPPPLIMIEMELNRVLVTKTEDIATKWVVVSESAISNQCPFQIASLFILISFWHFPWIFYQACKFQVGSYSYDMTKMAFTQTNKVQG